MLLPIVDPVTILLPASGREVTKEPVMCKSMQLESEFESTFAIYVF